MSRRTRRDASGALSGFSGGTAQKTVTLKAALRAHATQIDPAGAFLITPAADQRRLWPTEEFELACTRVATDLPETDLFAGIQEKEEA